MSEASAGQEACDAERNPTDQKVGGSSPSERAQVRGPFPLPEGALLLTLLLTAGTLDGGRYGAGKDVGGLGERRRVMVKRRHSSGAQALNETAPV